MKLQRFLKVKRLKRQWGAKYNDPYRPVLIEKTPTNAARLRWLQKHFENAHFIGIVRNGYAVAEGIHRKRGHSLELSARQWAKSNEIMLNDFCFLYKKKLIYYEKLTESPDRAMSEIFDFIGLDRTVISISPKNKIRVHKEYSEIKNMNCRSFSALDNEQRNTIRRFSEDMFNKLGYET